MEFKNVTFRAPTRLIEQIDDLASLESSRTGLRVDRSSIIRRALERDLAQHKAETKQKAGKR